MIIQIIGLPGSGKTTLAKALKNKINAIHLNADEVRNFVNYDLGFTHADRLTHSRRLSGMSRLLSEQGYNIVVDFICPTKETRTAFGVPDVLVWVDRIKSGRYDDTNLLWEDPSHVDVTISHGMSIEEEVNVVLEFIEKL